MSKGLRWKILMILAVIALLALASYPLTESNVRDYLKREAVNQDEAFNQLLEALDGEYDLEDRKVPISGVELLKMKVDDLGIDLTRYFPDQENNKDAIRYIGKDTKGSLNLGLDLQGGMHVILAVDELELIKKGADNVDEKFIALMTTVKDQSSGSFQEPMEVLKEVVADQNFDMVPYYKEHYENKYGLEEGSITTNEQIYENFDRELQAANLGSLEILRKRVDKFGVSEPEIQKQGRNELLIQLPGVRDPEQTLDLIQGQAFLEFKLVDDDNDRLAEAIKNEEAPPGFLLKTYNSTNSDGEEKEETLLLLAKSDLNGEMLVTAYFGTKGGTGEPIVHIKFDKKGTRIFSNITKQHNATDNPPGRRLAIVLDGEILSAPMLRTHIPRGEAYIEGNFDFDSAKLLSSQLSAGAYPAPLMIKEQRSVGPSLGEDSIRQGIRAALAGLIVVIIFMGIYYLRAGLVANFALCLNIGFIIGVLCILPYLFGGFKATLTLPGIAGIILTIGMAVDANVLIFERIREELATGKNMKRAIAEGYAKAFLTIIDANLTTVIAALVLLNPLGFSYLPTSGPIKGFALTLTIGICTSMFTALVVTRVIFDLFSLSPKFTSLKMFQIFKRPNFDFIGKRWTAYVISGILILASIVSFVINGEKNLGIDFSGGVLIQRQFIEEVSAEKIREILDGIGLEGVSVQHYGGGKGIIIRAGGKSAREIDSAIKAALPSMIDLEIYEQRTEMVGPKVGRRLQVQALGAIILAVLAIMAYIWFRFNEYKFALGAVLALVHDVIITIGFLSGFLLLPIREFSIPIIAALLTIVGYSLNDTIVVFVRIRENMKSMRGESDETIINTSINQVLNRTLITSITTLIVVIFLFIFGGAVINDFAYALMVGVVVGTYSSVFIASPVLLFWQKRKIGK